MNIIINSSNSAFSEEIFTGKEVEGSYIEGTISKMRPESSKPVPPRPAGTAIDQRPNLSGPLSTVYDRRNPSRIVSSLTEQRVDGGRPVTTVIDQRTNQVPPRVNNGDVCILPPDAGSCNDYIPRWFYNSQSGRCEQFSYGSCGGNSNNFLDRHSCELRCQPG